jgi:cytochrome c peroxidase
MRLFRRKGNCANCHEISGKDALFMDNRFYNLGVGFTKVNPQIAEFVQALRAGEDASGFSFGVSRESINKQLNKWKKEKIVTLGGQNLSITILDVEALENIADGCEPGH